MAVVTRMSSARQTQQGMTGSARSMPGQPDEAPWAIILAGGDGVRLRPLIRQVAGDNRPKQFCAVLGSRTLWEHTARRAEIVAPGRILTVVTEAHEPFYTHLLALEPERCVVVQPENRGTAPGLLYGLLRLARLAPRASVVVLPSDHWVSDDRAFMAHASSALRASAGQAGMITLLGIVPDTQDADYGWIEPGASVEGDLRRVLRFWEKPAADLAAELREGGCLWNSFVMAGRVEAFLDLMHLAVPSLWESFQCLADSLGRHGEAQVARELFVGLPTVDFSRQVLQEHPDRLGVLPVSGVRWSDLGDPRRVAAMATALARGADLTLAAVG